jgi:putative endonuclease
MRTSAQQRGDRAEALVTAGLERDGWTILGRDVRVGRNELDVIAIDPGPPRAVVIVEVRWRQRRDFGSGEESVDWRKRSRLHRAAFRWLAEHRHAEPLPLRFDLVVVEPDLTRQADGVRVRHHRAAF